MVYTITAIILFVVFKSGVSLCGLMLIDRRLLFLKLFSGFWIGSFVGAVSLSATLSCKLRQATSAVFECIELTAPRYHQVILYESILMIEVVTMNF